MLARANAELRQAQEALRDALSACATKPARTKALARIADRLNAQLDLDTVLTAVCEETASAIGVSAVCVSLYHERSDDLRPVASFGLPADYRERSRPLPRAAYEARMQQERVIAVAPEPNHPPAERRRLRRPGHAHQHRHPHDSRRPAGGQPRRIHVDRGRTCSDDELALLDGIAAQAAQAIINARLYADAQRRLDNVQALREIDAAITGSIDLHDHAQCGPDPCANPAQGRRRRHPAVQRPDFNTLEYAAGIGFRSS